MSQPQSSSKDDPDARDQDSGVDAREVLRRIEAEAPERHWPIIGPVKGELLVEIIRQRRPQRVLELGALVGYSSTLMALNLPPGGSVTSVEVNPSNAELARRTHQQAGVANRCRVIVGDAASVIPGLRGPWDVVFIDADKEGYLNYLMLVEPQLAPGAVIVADNVKLAEQAVADYLAYVRDSGVYDSSYHDFGDDAVEVSRLREGS